MIALLFPGHGSQFASMGKTAYIELGRKADNLLERAMSFSGIDVFDLICNASDETLSQSAELSSIALFMTSVLYFEILRERGVAFDLTAGHSFGEYSQLYAAGIVELEDGLKLARQWGISMENSTDEACGMAAIIGMPVLQVEKIIENYAQVSIANINSDFQVVVSGETTQVEKTTEEALKMGAIKAVRLKTKTAYHTPFMQKARQELEKAIQETTFKEPICPIVTNLYAEPTKDKERITDSLLDQITNRIRWKDTIRTLLTLGVNAAFEVGSGEVLKKLTQTITSKIKFHAIV